MLIEYEDKINRLLAIQKALLGNDRDFINHHVQETESRSRAYIRQILTG